MKLYAVQIPVEHQESPFETYGKDELYKDAIITGNRRMNEYTTALYERFIEQYDNLYCEYFAVVDNDENKYYETVEDAINGAMPKENREPYTKHEIKRWEQILTKYDDYYNMDKWDIAECLSMIADEEYRYIQISGCVQSEWQEVYYNKHIDIEKLEADYFNTGTEWNIIESDEDYEDADELPTEDAYYVYCYGYNDDMIKQELSDASGIPIKDIILFKYEGYIQMPKYSRG